MNVRPHFGAAYILNLKPARSSSKDLQTKQGYSPEQEARQAAVLLRTAVRVRFNKDVGDAFVKGRTILLDNEVKPGNEITLDQVQRKKMERMEEVTEGWKLLSGDEQAPIFSKVEEEMLADKLPNLEEIDVEYRWAPHSDGTGRLWPGFHSPALVEKYGKPGDAERFRDRYF